MSNRHVWYILLDNSYWILNAAEAFLWIGIGAIFLLFLRRPAYRCRKFIAAIAFIAFGISDIVETQTGAWWAPWWLFAWKAACMLVFLWLLFTLPGQPRRNA